MDFSSTPHFAVVAALVAIVAAFFILAHSIVQKERTLSSIRQTWFAQMRRDLTLYSSYSRQVACRFEAAFPNRPQEVSKNKITEFYAAEGVCYDSAIAAYHSVLLQLDPQQNKQLIELLQSSDKVLHDPSILNCEFMAQLQDEITEESQILFKTQWNKLKVGGLAYRMLKLILLVFLCATPSLLAVLFWQEQNPIAVTYNADINKVVITGIDCSARGISDTLPYHCEQREMQTRYDLIPALSQQVRLDLLK